MKADGLASSVGNDLHTRAAAVAGGYAHFDSGEFRSRLQTWVSYHSESQRKDAPLQDYLNEALVPVLVALGFTSRLVENTVAPHAPFLIAERHEGDELPTILSYGHGDVVGGYDAQWREGLSPWELKIEGDRWYGRGSADNKGQHAINIAALAATMAARGGRLGFNTKFLFEMGEEISSPGLHEVCIREREALAADLLLASDGPRIEAERPTVFLGSRGAVQFELRLTAREGGHHSGNWGGVLSNPAVVLSHAIACLIDRHGRINVEGLRPPAIDPTVKAALADIVVGEDEDAPEIDPNWGEPGLTPSERLFGWNALEVLAFKAGNPDNPVNAIPPSAFAKCQLRFVVGTDWLKLQAHLEQHLQAHGFSEIEVKVGYGAPATRLNPADPWVGFVLDSMATTTGKRPALLPNLGGTIPNNVFADELGLPTVWVPHSYPACSQHAPNEHLLGSVAREALGMMAGLFWDIGEQGAALIAARQS